MTLFGWSALAVFSQLALVRMFSTMVGATTYYGNVFLLVAIFASATGLLAGRWAQFSFAAPYFLLGNFMTAFWLGKFRLLDSITAEFFWTRVAAIYQPQAGFDLHLAIIILCLVSVPLMFLIGCLQGKALINRNYDHKGYILMACGGMMGAIIFAGQNQFFPALSNLLLLWAFGFFLCLWPELQTRFHKVLALLPLLPLLLLGFAYSSVNLWSPYQRLNVVPVKQEGSSTQHASAESLVGYDVLTNGFFITFVAAVNHDDVPRWLSAFAPYAFRSIPGHRNVLVIGSGAGTIDVREAVHAGAASVEAVEIDPVLIELGRQIDPEHTYANPRVKVVNTDGRKYLARGSKRYDLIYYPFVDSQTLASNQARFRLDSFLYTVEGLKLAYSHLTPDGIFIVSFMAATPWLQYRMYDLLKGATGREVSVYRMRSPFHTLYCVSNGQARPMGPPLTEITDRFRAPSSLPVPTDDWPFFYSYQKKIPGEHLHLLITVLLLFISLLVVTSYLTRSGGRTGGHMRLQVYAFFSGAAFFFIEIRAISALTPILGSTYLGQASVVAAIILASLAGALLAASRITLSLRTAWCLLFAGLGLAFGAHAWFHPIIGNTMPHLAAYLTALLTPVFFAGFIFLLYIKDRSAETVLAVQKWNLLGGAIGGLAECSVILFGFQNALWVAFGFYIMAWAAMNLGRAIPSESFR